MPPTERLIERIVENGYRHACFVSGPSKSSDQVKRIVDELKKSIKGYATDLGLPPDVFLSCDIPIGAKWEKEISSALCASLCMVAICGLHYYRSSWCGREWAGMQALGRKRHGDAHVPIIPLVLKPLPSTATDGLRQLEEVPRLVSQLQCLDLSHPLLHCSNIVASPEFKKVVKEAVVKIADMAFLLAEVKADCKGFKIPKLSAFEEYLAKPVVKRYPFRPEPK